MARVVFRLEPLFMYRNRYIVCMICEVRQVLKLRYALYVVKNLNQKVADKHIAIKKLRRYVRYAARNILRVATFSPRQCAAESALVGYHLQT